MAVFNKENQCPKCGHDEAPEGERTENETTYVPSSGGNQEYISRVCKRCKYKWQEEPIS